MLRLSVLVLIMMSVTLGLRAQRPYRYDVELKTGEALLGVAMSHDSETYRDTLWTDTASPPVLLIKDKVRRVLSISDPIHPPTEVSWIIHDSCIGCGPPPDCDCHGHTRHNGLQLLDAKLGLSIRGSSIYTRATPTGPQTDTSSFFAPFSGRGTMLDIEANVAGGWRVGRWDFGLQLEVIPTDSFFYFPLSLHARYMFADNCCAWNVFANAGIPFDFSTGAPIFITPLFSERQRRYFSLGLGKIWPFDERVELAADLGYRYMVIPLSEIQCCPTIAFDNRFPARASHSFFFQFGVSF